MMTIDLGADVLRAETRPGNAVVVAVVAEAVVAIIQEVVQLLLRAIRMAMEIWLRMIIAEAVVGEAIVVIVVIVVTEEAIVATATATEATMTATEATMTAARAEVDAVADVAAAAARGAVVGVMAKAFKKETSEAGPWSRE